MMIFMIFVITFILTIAHFITSSAQKLLRQYTLTEYTQMNQQIVSNINNSISGVNKYFQYLISNRVLIESLQKKGFGVDPETYQSVLYFKNLMFSLLSSSQDIESALYISIDGNIVSSQSGLIYSDFFQSSSFLEMPFIEEMKINTYKTIWYTSEVEKNKQIYYIKGVKNPDSDRLLGFLCFIIDDNLFRDQISKIATTGGRVYICNESGSAFIHSGSEKIETLNPLIPIINSKNKNDIIEKNKNYYISNEVKNSWYVITEISKKYLFGQINRTISWVILFVILSVIFVVLISMYIAKKYTKDLSNLVHAMENASHGIHDTIPNAGSNMEFRILTSTYNIMIQNIDTLTANLESKVEEKTRTEKALKNLNETLEQKVSNRTLDLEESLTMLKETQNRLIENEKMASLGILISGIAHELNNPLNYISNGIEAIQKVLPDMQKDPLLKELFNNINIGVERATEIIIDLSDYTTIHKDNKESINIHDCIELSLKILYNEHKTSIKIIKNYSKIPEIRGNKGKIIQVIMNILKNGIDALKENDHNKKEIRINTDIYNFKQKEYIRIDFLNNGPGIPEKELIHIFDPFYTTKDPGKGTGLGLSISQNIVKNHKGKIEVVNLQDSVCFSVSLPVRK
jgi:signal transduction histidine kinase